MLRSFIMVCVLGLASTVAIGAPVRYDYVGVPIPAGSGAYTSFLPSGITQISGYFILDNPLAPSTVHGAIAPTKFMFTDGLVTVTDGTAGYQIAGGGGYGLIMIGTDAEGAIVDWIINLSRDFDAATGGGPPADRHHYIQTSRETGFVGSDQTAYRFPLTAGNQQAVAITYGTGTWSVSPVPIPPAVWLFGSALGALGVRRTFEFTLRHYVERANCGRWPAAPKMQT